MTVINGTFLSNPTGATGNTVTVPAGVTADMVCLISVGNQSPTAVTWTYTTSGSGTLTNLANGVQAGNLRVGLWWGTGFVAGDTITVTMSDTDAQAIAHCYRDDITAITGYAAGTRGGVSQAYTTTGSLTPTAGQPVLVVGMDRTSVGPTLTSITSSGGETVTTRDAQHSASGSAPVVGVQFADFIASASAARTATVTMSSGSTNGYAALLTATPKATGSKLRIHGVKTAGTTPTGTKLRIHGVTAAGTAPTGSKLRIHGVKTAGTAAVLITATAPTAGGPGQALTLTAAMTDGRTPDAWTWTQTTGPTATLTGTGPVRTLTVPSVMPPGDEISIEVTATKDGVTSTPAVLTITVLPQLSWAYDGTDWQGSRTVPA